MVGGGELSEWWPLSTILGAERPPSPVLNITVTLCVSPCVCQQAAQLFYVGLPSSYSLPAHEAPLPRLPSYESVRKKDRQRQIHMMIADRFGLNGTIETEVGLVWGYGLYQSGGMGGPEVWMESLFQVVT